MSKISYRYQTPIPMIFWKNGILDPSQKIYKNRLAFLTWAFSKCWYDKFTYSCTRDQAAKESGLSVKELRIQENFFVSSGYMEILASHAKKIPLSYFWKEGMLVEGKIIDMEKEANDLQKVANKNEMQVTDNVDAYDNSLEKEGKEIEKRAKKIDEKGQRNSRVENEEKGKERAKKTATFGQKEQIQITCLKETSKEKAPPQQSVEILSLFHEEKDLSAIANENISPSEENQLALEALVEMRDIKGITPKTIARWLRFYSFEDVLDSIYLMLSPSHKKATNPGGWIEKALQEGWPRKERIKKINHEFALYLKKTHKLNHLKINTRYCIDLRTEKDYYYHMDPKEFELQLRNCL